MRHEIIARMGRIFLALTLAIVVGAVASGCDSSAQTYSGEGGRGGGVDVTSLGEQFGFQDGDVLDVEYVLRSSPSSWGGR